MKYGIAIFPEKKIQDIANSYRKRYDPHYALIPPHITLKEPFEFDESRLQDATQHLELVSRETAPFETLLHKVSTFHPTTNVLYLAVQENESILTLHEQVNSGELFHERSYQFIPHITIGQKLPADEIHDIYGRLRMVNVKLTIRVDRFHLLYQLENGSWTIYQTFLLRG
ncbi:2'-5' RNA ligase family protein [Marininema halotolerans]|uniref:Putative phosphoesterase SAMN05444972_1203 n=1 Tax=Marininema halotolerans TaxID=1155944 RepID=A0A1I6UST0_9BACL|nr:2'-5' RNA ligase family protein [Marininema halotolerans]SFT04501.1 2'-5' RNA ligase [Marininema halotolerans]